MPKIQHMVLLKFKECVEQSMIDGCFAQLEQLKELIGGITHFSGGAYSSHEGMNKGFTHGFLMTFESAEARDIYLPHAEHERVKSAILPLVDDAIAFDFEF